MLGECEAGLAQVSVTSMNFIRTLSIGDEKFLKELVYCHKLIFPESMQNIFGDRYLMRSFYWFMLNHEKRGILVYEQGGRIIGFLTMRFSDDMDNFLNRLIYVIFHSEVFPQM